MVVFELYFIAVCLQIRFIVIFVGHTDLFRTPTCVVVKFSFRALFGPATQYSYLPIFQFQSRWDFISTTVFPFNRVCVCVHTHMKLYKSHIILCLGGKGLVQDTGSFLVGCSFLFSSLDITFTSIGIRGKPIGVSYFLPWQTEKVLCCCYCF